MKLTKKLGIRTNSTIRNNKFDSVFYKMQPYMFDDNGLKISLNKKQNWKILEKNSIPIFKSHITSESNNSKNTAYTNKSPNGYCGGCPYITCYNGKNITKIITNKKTKQISNDEQLLNNCIILPFSKTEYPLFRQYNKIKSEPCPCCFQHAGRIWQLKGLGKKSKNKTKGMKKINKTSLSTSLFD